MEYSEIVKLRSQAEATADPELYERAAAEFEAIGMDAAAGRCRERAQHYRGMYGNQTASVPKMQSSEALVVEQIYPGKFA